MEFEYEKKEEAEEEINKLLDSIEHLEKLNKSTKQNGLRMATRDSIESTEELIRHICKYNNLNEKDYLK